MNRTEALRALHKVWPSLSKQQQGHGYRLDLSYSVAGLHRCFVIASIPAFLVGVYITTEGLTNYKSVLQIGALASVAVSCSLLWHVIYAVWRGRTLDTGWLMHGWFFLLLVPWTTSLPLVILGVSFGVVVGALIFGGTGRYLVSPALLGVLFLKLSYPTEVVDPLTVSTWQQLISGQSEVEWQSVFLSQQTGSLGTVSTAACMLGLSTLWLLGAISLRIVAGALLGATLATSLFSESAATLSTSLPFFWYWILGSLPFCLAFLVTDPSASATTNAGRWYYGFLFGTLAVTLCLLNPDHPEATLPAALLASLFAPIIDQCCVRVALYRRQRRMRIDHN